MSSLTDRAEGGGTRELFLSIDQGGKRGTRRAERAYPTQPCRCRWANAAFLAHYSWHNIPPARIPAAAQICLRRRWHADQACLANAPTISPGSLVQPRRNRTDRKELVSMRTPYAVSGPVHCSL